MYVHHYSIVFCWFVFKPAIITHHSNETWKLTEFNSLYQIMGQNRIIRSHQATLTIKCNKSLLLETSNGPEPGICHYCQLAILKHDSFFHHNNPHHFVYFLNRKAFNKSSVGFPFKGTS